MRKQKTIFEQLKGLKPIDAKKAQELKKKISGAVPRVVDAVEKREFLAAASRYRELEGVKRKENEPAERAISSEDAHKRL